MGASPSDDNAFVRSAETKCGGQRYKLTSAFANAGRGLFEAVRTERNLRIDACMALVAVAFGFALHIDMSSWLAVVICIGMMFALETVNTAIEAVVDLASPGYHELARKAKDCAAGAALAGAFASLIVGCIVFIPPFVALIA
ncbi:diacylglycerol kinase family protein [uncultured Senegalimassilia sp.]|uniref:diacylglycerol kinase family protein n=1 Tax=uncultured Senegalimassilia sp. TaxID=1714350 RepID=UPI0025D99022|nr:diacylglycerol kinase family protein [uncultured Senegalimassilia sp.]